MCYYYSRYVHLMYNVIFLLLVQAAETHLRQQVREKDECLRQKDEEILSKDTEISRLQRELQVHV